MTILFDNGHFVYNRMYVGVMVSILASNVVVRGVRAPVPGSAKNYEIRIFCLAAKHISLRSMSK